MLKCETCQSDIATVEEAHSMLVVLQKVTPGGYSWFQCADGQEHQGLTFQHFHCNRQEMLVGVDACIREHHNESLLVPVSPEQVKIHLTVLRAGLSCKVCGTPLNEQAYRFCLTHATPMNSVPDDSQNELGEWCCSLPHAQQAALAILASQ